MASRSWQKQPPPQPTDATGYRVAWSDVEQLWSGTMTRAEAFPTALLHERVDGEWSFVQTLRHLVFVTDAWGSRALLGVASPYHPWALPPTGMRNSAVVVDVDAEPSLSEVVAVRDERRLVVSQVFAELTDEAVRDGTVQVRGDGYPRRGRYPVRRCVQALLAEHWTHRLYAERDLAILQARG